MLPLFVVLWTSGYVVGAAAIEVADPLPLLAVRFVLAAAVLVPLAVRGGRWRGAPLGRLAVLGVPLHVVQFGGIYGGFALGVPAALSALVMLGLTPLVTTGLAVASGQKRWGGTTDPLVSAAAQSVAAAVLVAPVAAVAGGRFDVSAQLVLCLAWIVLGLAVGTLLLYVHLLRVHAASTVTALLLLVPPVTAFASALTLGEALHPASLVGMVVALAGVGAVLRRARQEHETRTLTTDRLTGASGAVTPR